MSLPPRAHQPDILACHHCDLMVSVPSQVGFRPLLCPRCRTPLWQPKKDHLNRTFALTVTGLFLFILANTMPVFGFTLLGQTTANTLLDGVLALSDSGFYILAFLVLFCSVIVPLVTLTLHMTACITLLCQRGPVLTILALRSIKRLHPWGMLDVYLLSLLVAFIKLRDDGELVIGPGLAPFVLLLICEMAAQTTFDPHQAWLQLERDTRAPEADNGY